MGELVLKFPTLDMKEQALIYRQEYLDNGETEIHGDGGLDHAVSYEAWIEKINVDLTRGEGSYVPATTYFAFTGNKIVGTVQIRHMLNSSLLVNGGHIGYGVVPSERRKGYATRMLSSALVKCRELGIKRALITCDKDNIGSAKTIIKNGGVLENEVLESDGNILQRYWIDVPSIKMIAIDELPACLEVIHRSFTTVAREFGITERNCPNYIGFTELEKLKKRFDSGYMMFGLFKGDETIGFFSLSDKGSGVYELNNLCVLPEHRHMGYGKQLLEFTCDKVRELGGKKITIGIIEENTLLRDWYSQNGFVHTGTMTFPHLPFTVGFMEKEI